MCHLYSSAALTRRNIATETLVAVQSHGMHCGVSSLPHRTFLRAMLQLQPASMSGRTAILATSPEQAHAAAHAQAMAAMAAGFSPHTSLAATYGLPEGATPYGSHPLLQLNPGAFAAAVAQQQAAQAAAAQQQSPYGGGAGSYMTGGHDSPGGGGVGEAALAASPQLGGYGREAGSPLVPSALAASSGSLGSGGLGRGSMDLSPARRPPISRLSSGKLQQLAAHQLRVHYAAAAGQQQVQTLSPFAVSRRAFTSIRVADGAPAAGALPAASSRYKT